MTGKHAEYLAHPRQDRPMRVDREARSRGYAGAYLSFQRHAKKAGTAPRIDTSTILVERAAGEWREDMIADVALQRAAERARGAAKGCEAA